MPTQPGTTCGAISFRSAELVPGSRARALPYELLSAKTKPGRSLTDDVGQPASARNAPRIRSEFEVVKSTNDKET